MIELKYVDLIFMEHGDMVKVTFQKYYEFFLERTDLERIGKYEINKGNIVFEVSEKRARNKLNLLIKNGFLDLRNKITGRNTIFINSDSGIPLIGNNSFGLVDRNTSIIEVKPNTGCNLNCIFCSVDEGKSGRWITDFVIDHEYLVHEFEKLAEFKGCKVEAHIGTHGEPLLYPKLIQLINGLHSLSMVKRITIDTNSTLLTKKLVDELADAGLTRLQLSINAIDKGVAEKLAGTSFNHKHVLKIAEYAAKKIDILLAPIWVPGYNDEEIPKLIEFGKSLGVDVCFQNFLNYRFGRNPVKQESWGEFRKKMTELEKTHKIKLLFNEKDFDIEKTNVLPKPFKKGQVVKVFVICKGRLKNEKIVIAKHRNITVKNCTKKGLVKVKITGDKHNIFYAK